MRQEIENGVHPYLILNIDQVWRAALRFNKTVLMKGKQRAFAKRRSTFQPIVYSANDDMGVVIISHFRIA